MTYATIDPTTGNTLETFDDHDDAEVERRLAAADVAHDQLRSTTFDDRAGWMRAAADILDDEAATTAHMMTTEMGKPLAQAKAEVGKSATALRFYADNAESLLGSVAYDASSVNASQARTIWQPLGVVLAIMPWNFPMWQAVRFAAPALMAGNTGVLKHAPNVPRTAVYLGELFARAGFPPGAFQHLFVDTNRVEQILADDRIRAATLTGSERAGRAVAEIAGRNLKKVVLELGGSDPFLVLPSADLDKAAQVATTARCQNNGQSCIAAKRFIVHADVYDEFVRLFTAQMSAQTVGDPTDEATNIGPLATERGRDDVADAVREATEAGARVLAGGHVPDDDGWWYPPTVVTDIPTGTTMYDDEVFGPVAGLFRVDSYDEAVAVANDVPYGLGASAWTNDDAEQHALVRDLEAGMVYINGMTASFPQLPFGGIGNSGYGRELSDMGLKEFCNAKTVWIA